MFYRAIAATCPGNEKEYNSHNIYLNSKYITEDIKASEVLLRQKKEQEGLQFYAISEGFGADRYADEASLIAIKKLASVQAEAVKEELSDDYDEAADSLYSYLESFVNEAEEAVVAKSTELAPDNIYASLAAVAIYENAMIACNLGNTKIFLYRKGKLNLLSEEHNQAYKMFKNGIIDEERFSNHPKRSKLTQYLGILPDDKAPSPYFSEAEIKHGDILVICSSTFCEKVSEDEICEMIKNSNSLTQITEKLMMASSEDGFAKDTSVLVIRADSHEKVAGVAGSSVAGNAAAGMAGGTVAGGAATGMASNVNVPTAGAAGTAEVKSNIQNAENNLEDDISLQEDNNNKLNDGKVPFSKKFKRFLGLTSDNENEKIWPALLTFGCCLLVVVLLGILGWKIYDISSSDDNSSNKGASISSESPFNTGIIPTGNPSGEPTATSGTDIDDPTSSPSADTTSKPTTAPTEAPETEKPIATVAPTETVAPTAKPTAKPTQAPATEKPTVAPTAKPTAKPTQAPATDVPATDAPVTDAPATEAPATDAPATEAPATEAPATDAPATDAPTTDAPATDAPTTDAPTTDAPATDAPTTDASTGTDAASENSDSAE